MPVISQDNQFQTVITTYDVTPANFPDLVALLKEACHDFMRNQPGFVGGAMHVNDAQTRVANYTQWACREDFLALTRSAEMQAYNARYAALSKSFKPIMYDVIMSVDADS